MLYVEQRGTGPDIIMLHGWCANSSCWDLMIAELCKRYRLHLVDLPGHGNSIGVNSSLSDIEMLIEQLVDITPPQSLWLGWSMGGLLAQMVATHQSAHARSLISLCMGVRYTSGSNWPYGMTNSMVRRLSVLLHTNPSQCMMLFTEMMTASNDTSAMLDAIKKIMSIPVEMDELVAGLKWLSTADCRETIRDCTLPILYIACEFDQISEKKGIQASAQLCPNATYKEISNCGHVPMLSHPKTLIKLIDSMV